MSHSGTSSTLATQAPAFRDRTGGLVAFGVVLVLVGVFSLVLGLLTPVALFLGAPVGGGDGGHAGALPGGDWRSVLSSMLMHLLGGAVFIWLGAGSLQRRRWVGPVALSVAWLWLIAGAMALAMCVYMTPELRASMEAMVASQGQQDPDVEAMLATMLTVVLGVMLLALGVLGVALPGLMVLFFRSPHVRATCEARWPETTSWTDDCPTRLVGLSLSLGLLAGVLVAATPYAAVPAFGVVLTGAWAAITVLLIVAACTWLAVLVAQRRYAGWVGTVVLLVVVTIGPLVNAVVYSPAEQMKHLGMHDPAFEALLTPELLAKSHTTMLVGFVIIALITVVYMLKIRPDFTRASSG